MGKVSVSGTLTCREGKGEETAAVLVAMVEAARHEPGVEIYSYHRVGDDSFAFFALMADEASMRHHGRSAAMQEAMASFGPLMAEPPQMTVMTPVAALGFDI